MTYLSTNNLRPLSLGATLLGSGGGGDPTILYNHLHYLLDKNGPVRIIQPEKLPPQSLVVPIALIGAPLISLERIPNSTMFLELLKAIRKHYPERELILMPAEIGGCNALTPFMLAAQTSLPVLDADLIGRAFPKLHMCKPAILGKKKLRSYLASPFGDCVTIETNSLAELELRVREATVNFGCSAAIATFLFDAEEQEPYLIPGSLTRAQDLGRVLQTFAGDLPCFAAKTSAKLLGSGLITEVCHAIEDGFLTGYACIKMPDQQVRVFYQNEYLLALAKNERTAAQEAVLAGSPELIVILESRSGRPLTSECLRYGLKVDLFSLPPPSFWETAAARAEVDLEAFGLTPERGFLYV